MKTIADSDFDRPIDITPSRGGPIISAGAAAILGVSIVVVAFFAFASCQPDAAVAMARGVGHIVEPIVTFALRVAEWVAIGIGVVLVLAFLGAAASG